MTTKPEKSVVEALEYAAKLELPVSYYDIAGLNNIAKEALPLARDLYRYKKALEWLIIIFPMALRLVISDKVDCPPLIKKLFGRNDAEKQK